MDDFRLTYMVTMMNDINKSVVNLATGSGWDKINKTYITYVIKINEGEGKTRKIYLTFIN